MLRLLMFTILLISFSNCKDINQRKDKVTIQLNELQEGTLLVKLPTFDAKISKLKEMGKFDEAKKVHAFNQQFHFDIIHSFSANFSYCDVYFFYSNHTEDIKRGEIKGKVFDSKRKNIEKINTPLEQMFFAEFGQVHQEEIVVEKDGKKIKVAGLGGKDALVLRTIEGIQPNRPFPYSVDYKSLFNGNLNKTVRKLNSRLYRFKRKMDRRKLRRARRGK